MLSYSSCLLGADAAIFDLMSLFSPEFNPEQDAYQGLHWEILAQRKITAPKLWLIIENKGSNSNPLWMCLKMYQTTVEQAENETFFTYKPIAQP